MLSWEIKELFIDREAFTFTALFHFTKKLKILYFSSLTFKNAKFMKISQKNIDNMTAKRYLEHTKNSYKTEIFLLVEIFFFFS